MIRRETRDGGVNKMKRDQHEEKMDEKPCARWKDLSDDKLQK